MKRQSVHKRGLRRQEQLDVLRLPIRAISHVGAACLVQPTYEIAGTYLQHQLEVEEGTPRPRDTKMDARAAFVTSNWRSARDNEGGLARNGKAAYPKCFVLRKAASRSGVATGAPLVTPAEILGMAAQEHEEFGAVPDEATRVRLLWTADMLGLLEEVLRSEDPLSMGLRFPRVQRHLLPGGKRLQLQIRSSDLPTYREEVRVCCAALMVVLPHIRMGKHWKRNPFHIPPRNADELIHPELAELLGDQPSAGELVAQLEMEASPTLHRLLERHEACKTTRRVARQVSEKAEELTSQLKRAGERATEAGRKALGMGQPADMAGSIAAVMAANAAKAAEEPEELEVEPDEPELECLPALAAPSQERLAEPQEPSGPSGPWTTVFRSFSRLAADLWRLVWHCVGWDD